MRFTYQIGAQPLTGYTIQRGIHRGGFGEVYYAHSNGGKEVALKLLHEQDQDIEIRGVTQCLNLKHPNLVNLFDLKTDEHGDTWVVMEYIAGSSLEDILGSFPEGLPLTEVRDWLIGLVAGIAHLHDRGIVHRDLKPANVFRENGVVKVGDVGLSKRLDSDRRNVNTQSVGTVYYMAPEVARGQYGPEVDVYSLGIILYEMITGKLPFTGETTGEILMKHLTAQPDLGPIPKSFRPMLARAMEKDPRKRTPTVRQLELEFLKAERSSSEPETIPESAFLPPLPHGTNGQAKANGTSKTNVPFNRSYANNSAKRANSSQQWIDRRRSNASEWIAVAAVTYSIIAAIGYSLFESVISTGTSIGLLVLALVVATKDRIFGSLHSRPPGKDRRDDPVQTSFSGNNRKPRPFSTNPATFYRDPTDLDRPWNERFHELTRSIGLSAIIAALVSMGIYFAFTATQRPLMPSAEHAALFAATSVVGSWLLLISHAVTVSSHSTKRHRFLARLVAGVLIGSCAYGLNQFLLVNIPSAAYASESAISLLNGHPLRQVGGNPTWLGYVCFFALCLGIRRWSRDMDPGRERHFSVWLVAAAVAVAYGVSLVFYFPQVYAMLWAGTISTTVQLSSNWSPKLSSPERR